MSITVVRAAFERGLDGRGTCLGCTMDYESGGRQQRVRFRMGDGETVEFVAAAAEDLPTRAHAAGAAYQPKG